VEFATPNMSAVLSCAAASN